jgi:TPR repeat protein
MSEPAAQTESSEKKPSFLLLKALIFPVLVIPALVVTLLVIRGNEAEQLYYRAMDAADRGDFAAAASYFERASNLGHAQSAYNLALLYDNHTLTFVYRNNRTVTDDILTAFGIGITTTIHLLLRLGHEHTVG